MKIRNYLLSGCLIAALCSCGTSQKENLNLTLSKDTLFDKVKGAWAGQILGCTYGGPTEFQYLSTMIPDSVVIPWGNGEIKKWFDGGGGLYDDVYVDLTFVETFERCGLDAPVDSFAAAFLAKEYPLCHANQQARYNLLQGLSPHASGYWKNNPHANCLDFQIEADFAGIMSPGMVNNAVDFCDRIGHIMAYGDGWYGGVYVAAMYSLAYVSDDIEYIVTEGLKAIPQQSRFYACMTDVINWHKQYPDDWKKCWEEIEKKWGTNDIACPDGVEVPFNIETYVNGAYIILGLLYGQGDFEKTIDISTRAGQDSDCNPASSGGILGTMLGYNRLPEKYKAEVVTLQLGCCFFFSYDCIFCLCLLCGRKSGRFCLVVLEHLLCFFCQGFYFALVFLRSFLHLLISTLSCRNILHDIFRIDQCKLLCICRHADSKQHHD